MPVTQKKPSFFWHSIQKESPYVGPYIGIIVKCHVHNFLLNNITTQTTFEEREKAEKKAFIFIACLLCASLVVLAPGARDFESTEIYMDFQPGRMYRYTCVISFFSFFFFLFFTCVISWGLPETLWVSGTPN